MAYSVFREFNHRMNFFFSPLLALINLLVFNQMVFGESNNLALKCSVTSSSCSTLNLNSYLTDGDTSSYWAVSGGTYPQWVKVDLGSIKPISNVVTRYFH